MRKLNKTDTAWSNLFEKYKILNSIETNGIYNISSTQINEFREARLMTKFDHSVNLPLLFSQNNLSILPDSRGTYIIGKFKTYKKLSYENIKPTTKMIPNFIQSFDNLEITSESNALNIAHMSGMIDDVLNTLQDEPNSVMTLSGRMGSGEISFNIKTKDNFLHQIHVKNSQIEIDGSYENLNKIGIIEAKNKLPEDFHIRQLYYPYRFYKNLNTNKEILPIFFTYVDDIFSFHIYKFENINEFTSLKKINQINFILNNSLDLNLEDIKKISASSKQKIYSGSAPFPQADNFSRILDMIEYLTTPRNKTELALDYSFDIRQSDYYANSLVYLGLAEKNNGKFHLSNTGLKIKQMHNSNKRNTMLISLILEHKVFKLAFDSTLKNGGEFDKEYIVRILLENISTIKSLSTAERRASTVKSWVEWIFSVID